MDSLEGSFKDGSKDIRITCILVSGMETACNDNAKIKKPPIFWGRVYLIPMPSLSRINA